MRNTDFQIKIDQRKGAILVLGVVLLIAVFAFVSFTVDVGHVTVVRTQLQSAADAAALGSAHEIPLGQSAVKTLAKSLAAKNKAAGKPVSLTDADIELGFFDFAKKSFVADADAANAVRVTARVNDEGLFFAPIMGTDSFDQSASSIGMLNPRDIVFVVDLSGSMNDDTEPCWATDALTAKYTPLGYPTVASNLMQTLYSDFNYGTFPGAIEYLGDPLGVASDEYAYAEMTKDDGPLAGYAVDAKYRIENTDSEATRKQKAYLWIIENQISDLMPNVTPIPDAAHFTYWEKYIDYIIHGTHVGNAPLSSTPPSTPPTTPTGPTPPPATGSLDRNRMPLFLDGLMFAGSMRHPAIMRAFTRGLSSMPVSAPVTLPGCPRRGGYDYVWLPTSHDGDRIYYFNNPNRTSFPTATAPWGWRNWIGYRTYIQFMMDWGRERSPESDNAANANPALAGKTPLSALSPDCPFREEMTAGGKFQFPPRCQPMHSVRRALIAGVQLIKERNTLVSAGTGDRVAIITFDGTDNWHAPHVVQTLSDDFDKVMLACTTLQAASDIGATTSTESGIALARQLLTPKSAANNPTNDPNGPQGRTFTSKVLVLVTDGMPNAWDMSASAVDTYVSNNTNSNYYPTGYDWFNSVLVQTHQFYNTQRGKLYGVGMGLGTDYEFMDRVSRMASTDINGQSPRGSGNPAQYEQTLINMLTTIINRAGSRLVE